MKLHILLSYILPVASRALTRAREANIVGSDALRGSIAEAELTKKAKTIEGFAYASPDKNRFLGTPGHDDTMQYIWDTLEDLDYYNIERQWFEFNWFGMPFKTYNIIAQTKKGDPDNVLHLGAHMDSTLDGPGMNDNASGGIGILEVAIQLANHSVNNAVRFSWWSAEEEGLIGSYKYVQGLSEEERKRIRLYLNFDMIASPSHEFGVYTSDFQGAGVPQPPGVEEAEKLFQDYYQDVADLEWRTVTLRKSSDHWPFVEAGIPTGGLFAGKDPNYHSDRDTVANMNSSVFVDTTKAIAHAVATYAKSFESFPPRQDSRS